MKPLPPAPLTEEDLEAWGQVCERFRPGGPCYWYEATRAADRRDAELMLSLESHRRNHAPPFLVRFGQLHGFGGPFRAFANLPERDAQGDITNFA